VGNGYREIVLTGVHLGHYGVDWNFQRQKEDWVRLSHLVRMIAELAGEFRIRLSSIEATEVTKELIDVMRRYSDRICPHLHICLQSGSDAVLRRMKRRWGAKRFVDRCKLVQDVLDQPSITTDIIVGFPGETAEEFQQTCDVAEQVGFSKIHVFPFSARRGTPAAEMPDQLTKKEKQARVRQVMEIEIDLRQRYYSTLEGRRLQVLVEKAGEQEHTLLGTSCRYAPVELAGAKELVGQLVEVQAIGTTGDRLLARQLTDDV
jgi:threonylcarbamoyladenosine tRNA methylthiotransferase MtaB